MTKTTKRVLIFLAATLALGGICIALAVALGGRFEDSLSDVAKPISGDFTRIEITAAAASIYVKKSQTGESYALAHENTEVYFSVEAADGVLKIREVDTRAWYDKIGIFWGTRSLTLYLNGESYEALTVKLQSGGFSLDHTGFSFGDVALSAQSGGLHFVSHARNSLSMKTLSGGISVGVASPAVMRLSVQSGGVSLANATPSALTVTTQSGGIRLRDVRVSGDCELSCQSGGVSLSECDAEVLTVKTQSGSVSGTLLRDMVFDVRTGSGAIDVPPSKEGGGRATVTTQSGSVRLRIGQ